jgi:hypothetical protein
MPPIDLDPREDVTSCALWSKKRKAQDPLTDEIRREEASANAQQTPHLKDTIGKFIFIVAVAERVAQCRRHSDNFDEPEY